MDVNNELIERVANTIRHDKFSRDWCTALEVAQDVLAELAVELRDGTCEWWEDGEMWESSCGVAYTFIDTDGPADNGHTFCHKCGKRIAIDEARGSMIVR